MTDDRPVAFADLARHDFPCTIQLWDEETEELVFEAIVREPGALPLPGRMGAAPRTAVVIFPNRLEAVNSRGESWVFQVNIRDGELARNITRKFHDRIFGPR